MNGFKVDGMTSQEKLERIDKFLLGELEGVELEAFRQNMESDPEFAAEVALQQTIFQAITDTYALRFMGTLDEIERERDGNQKSGAAKIISLPLRRILTIAATVLLLLVAGFFLFKDQWLPSQPERLYAAYFEIPAVEDIMDPAIIARSRDQGHELDEVDQRLSTVAGLYRNGDYPVALEQLESTDVDSVKNPANYYFTAGILYLINDKPEAALNSFENIASGYQDGRNWYGALALLKLDRVEEAKEKLRQLTDSTNPWQESAGQILDRLD